MPKQVEHPFGYYQTARSKPADSVLLKFPISTQYQLLENLHGRISHNLIAKTRVRSPVITGGYSLCHRL